MFAQLQAHECRTATTTLLTRGYQMEIFFLSLKWQSMSQAVNETKLKMNNNTC